MEEWEAEMEIRFSKLFEKFSKNDVKIDGIMLDFEPVDPERFICFKLALQALEQGGIGPTVFNAANEVAVDAFLGGRLPYLGIQDVIERTLNEMEITEPENLDAVIDVDRRAREVAEESLTVT